MSTVFAIYQWGVVVIFIAGVFYAVSGIREGIPFTGRSKYSDSVFNRIAAGAGIAAIWPLFILYFLLRKRGK